MSQHDVIEVLRKNYPRWMSSKDIRQYIKESSCQVNLTKVKQKGLVDFKLVKSKNYGRRYIYLYRYKK